MKEDIEVSVYCLAYNHEKYIRKTLEGFVNQKTDFKYEVIVHDDASRDGTRAIIEEFVKNYPEIFVPIYQQENQFSKKISIIGTYIYPKVRGKYVAICEGDDYWTDVYKLKKQKEILDNNSGCAITTHIVGRITENGEPLSEKMPREELNYSSGLIDKDSFVERLLVDGYIFQTSSYFFRKEIFRIFADKKPEFVQFFNGDYSMLCVAASYGDCYFINEEMSKYRVMSEGSWTSRLSKDKTAQIRRYERSINGLNKLDEYTQYKYHASIVYALQWQYLSIYRAKGEYRFLLKYIKFLNSKQDKIKYFILGIIDVIFPNIIITIRGKLNGKFKKKSNR